MRLWSFLLLLLVSGSVYAGDVGQRTQFEVKSKTTTVVSGVVRRTTTAMSYSEMVFERSGGDVTSLRQYSRFAEGVIDAKVRWQVIVHRTPTGATHEPLRGELHPSAQSLLEWELSLPRDASLLVTPNEPKSVGEDWPIGVEDALLLARTPRESLATPPKRARARRLAAGIEVLLPLRLVDGTLAPDGKGGQLKLSGATLRVQIRIESKPGGIIVQRWKLERRGTVAKTGGDYWHQVQRTITRTPLPQTAIPIQHDRESNTGNPRGTGEGLIHGFLGKPVKPTSDKEDSAFIRAYRDLRRGFMGRRSPPHVEDAELLRRYHHFIGPRG